MAVPSPSSHAPSPFPIPSSNYVYPPLYGWPPFYTLQPNLTTRSSQLASWTEFILDYCTFHRVFRLTSSHPLFTNTRLHRKLQPDDCKEVFAHMVQASRAEPVDATSSKKTSNTDEIWVYWKTVEEWAAEMAQWVELTGQRNTVLTLYELLEGDATEKQAFHGLPIDMAKKSLGVLVRRQKASMFGEGEGLGVKFY